MSILRSLSNRVYGGVFLGQRPKPSLRFGGLSLKEAKSLSDYRSHDRCIHQLKTLYLGANEPDRPYRNPKPLEVNWKTEHEKTLLDLFIKHAFHSKNLLSDVVAEFNQKTNLTCRYNELEERLRGVAMTKGYSTANSNRNEMPMHTYLDLFKEVYGCK